ncbi:MAG: regulatory iron-sulfur-containing complex subunit RicT [bacterium]
MRLALVELDPDIKMRCSSPAELAIREEDHCVLDCCSTLEFGRIIKIWEEELSPEDSKNLPHLLRRATLQDHSRAQENAVYLKMASDNCFQKVNDLKLNMRIISVRHSFDRKVVTIAYTSEERIQFRDLLKDLSTELNARIEMKQIGIRDAAGVIGGMGVCGRKLCCSSWLHEFAAVSVRMAKTQRLSLNPNTISGMCGRLKCCLRYENETYSELGSRLPRDGSIISCPGGKGCVIEKNILAQKVKVRFEDDRIQEFDISELTNDRHG